jgi:hypothetical protein
MLGKSGGLRACITGPLLAGVIALLATCANNVPQDKKTGPDGKIKGAKEMVLDNNEAKATGVVTYPGGDRVDWKMIQLPDKKRGTLELSLQWTPPRPGLQLAFDVFDEWNELLVSSSKKTGKKKAKGRQRSATLENAKGKYFIRVYAVERGDAGKYKLNIEFKEQVVGPTVDILKLEIPDPPKLAAVPDIVEPCTDDNFDQKKPECKKFCPTVGAPEGWAACEGKCPKKPSIDIEACWATMPCPKPADKRVKACKLTDFPPCPDPKQPDPNNPRCDIPPDPKMARMIAREAGDNNEIVVRIAIGSDQGVSKEGWKAMFVTGPSVKDKAVPGGEIKIISVDKTRTKGTTKLTAGQVDANPNVKFVPNPK